jgi:hypothetical protein
MYPLRGYMGLSGPVLGHEWSEGVPEGVIFGTPKSLILVVFGVSTFVQIPGSDPGITVFGVVLERFRTAYKGVQALLGFGGVPEQCI